MNTIHFKYSTQCDSCQGIPSTFLAKSEVVGSKGKKLVIITSASPIDNFLSRLRKVKSYGAYYAACCPAHNDEHASLTVWEDKGRCAFECHASCSHKAVIDALGIMERELHPSDMTQKSFPQKSNLTVNEYAAAKGFSPRFLRECGVESIQAGVKFTYYNLDGSTYQRYKVRSSLDIRGKWDTEFAGSGIPAIPYGLDRLCKSNGRLFIVEGESDCLTLWRHGYNALGMPGANTSSKLLAEYINLFPEKVYIVQEHDKAGEKFANDVEEILRARKYQGVIVHAKLPWKDPNELLKQLVKEDRTRDFRRTFEEALVALESGVPTAAPEYLIKATDVPLGFIEECEDAEQYGDAQLFARCFKDQVVHDHAEKEWYLWNGNHWGMDTNDQLSVLICGHLGSVYLKGVADLNTELAKLNHHVEQLSEEEADKLKKRITRIPKLCGLFRNRCHDLRKSLYKNSVKDLVRSQCPVPVNADKTSVWDSKRNLLGVKNGVVDLKTGEFRHGQPQDYIRTTCPTEWRGLDEKCPLFEKYIEDLFELREDRSEIIAFLQRVLGYALTGSNREALFVLLHGLDGRNGKTTLFQIIVAAVGKALAGDIKKEVLLDTGKSAQANGAHPDVLALQGKRFAIVAETKKGDKLNISAIKNFTGGDELSGRPLYGKKDIRFAPSHTLFMHTNFRPHADANDPAFWARACVIEFSMRFLEEPDPNKANERKYDPELAGTIIANELSGVLAWLVRGALDYHKLGLKKPASVKLANEQYRIEEDTVLSFIQECCMVGTDCKVGTSALYEAYKVWSGEGFKLNSKEFPKKVEKLYKKDHEKTGWYYYGIGLVQPDDIGSIPDVPDSLFGIHKY